MRIFDHEGKVVGGLRELKKRETKKRITEKGIALFLRQGIDQTTLDEIAAAAGISRRTFFYYFKSKDEILLSMLSGIGEMLTDAVRRAADRSNPMTAAKEAVLSVCSTIPSSEMIELDRLMRTSPNVQARKQAFYVQQEDEMYAALRELWPAPERSIALRTTAMLSVGAIRLAGDIFHQEKGSKRIAEILNEIFESADMQLRSRDG